MKKYVAAASLIALAACGQSEAPVDKTEGMAAEEPQAELPAGIYTVDYGDGDVREFTMNEDGTWAGTTSKGEPVSGTYEDVEGKTCFSADGDDSDPTCWSDSEPNEDGTFVSTNDEGVTVMVTPPAF